MNCQPASEPREASEQRQCESLTCWLGRITSKVKPATSARLLGSALTWSFCYREADNVKN